LEECGAELLLNVVPYTFEQNRIIVLQAGSNTKQYVVSHHKITGTHDEECFSFKVSRFTDTGRDIYCILRLNSLRQDSQRQISGCSTSCSEDSSSSG
jgi:hypothetical protein